MLVEICRDLGITTQHPEWQEIKLAIIVHCGNLVRLLMHWLRPTRDAVAIAVLEDAAARAGQTLPVSAHPP